MEHRHYVYKITNLISGKIYIGKHSTRLYEDEDFYMGSSEELKDDIYKLGIENFKKEIIYKGNTKLDIALKEAELVDRKFINRSDTYNKVKGGFGGYGTKDEILEVKEALKNKNNLFDIGKDKFEEFNDRTGFDEDFMTKKEKNSWFEKKHKNNFEEW